MAKVVNGCLEKFPGQILAPVRVPNVVPQTFAVCFDYRSPQAGLELLESAMTPTGKLAFTMRRADFAAAGIREKTLIARPSAPTHLYVVDSIEDDDARPFVRVTAQATP